MSDWPRWYESTVKTTCDGNRVVMVWARTVRRMGTRNLVRERFATGDGRIGRKDVCKEEVGNDSAKDNIYEGLEDYDLE